MIIRHIEISGVERAKFSITFLILYGFLVKFKDFEKFREVFQKWKTP